MLPVNRVRKEAGDSGETCGFNWAEGYDDEMGCGMTLNPAYLNTEENLNSLHLDTI
jgi:hypothetical protein